MRFPAEASGRLENQLSSPSKPRAADAPFRPATRELCFGGRTSESWMEPGSCGLFRWESEQETLLPSKSSCMRWGGETYPLQHGTGPGYPDPLLAGEPGWFCRSESSKGEMLEARDIKQLNHRSPIVVRLGACISLSSLAKNVHTLSLPFPPPLARRSSVSDTIGPLWTLSPAHPDTGSGSHCFHGL